MLSKSKKHTIDFLDQQRGVIRSRTGGWFPGKGVFSHGYSMLDELVGEKSYFQILVLNATGRLIERPLADWIEAIYGCLSWPDPRIWCNQIGALGGTAKTSVVAATTMGILATDSRNYGVLPIIESTRFINDVLHRTNLGESIESIVKDEIIKNKGRPNIAGYKRPIAKGDERITTMERVSKKLGFNNGPCLDLAYQVQSILMRDFDEGMNINGYVAAFLSDENFSAKEIYNMSPMLVMSGVNACYVETEKRPADSFLTLRCNDIDYQGKEKRQVPQKDEAV